MQSGTSAAGGSNPPFGSLFIAVFTSILEVVLVCSAGYILASKGILDKKTQKQLNRLNVNLLTPALLFSKVALYLTPEKLKELWVIPIYFAIVTLVSGVVGSALGHLFKLRRSQRSFVMAAAMFMNSNSLPIALMQSLVVAVPDLMWGADDTKNIMLGRALTYLTMYSTLGMVIRYSYGIRLLARADTEVVQVRAPTNPDERTPLLSEEASTSTFGQHLHDSDSDERRHLLSDLEASTSTLGQHAHESSATFVNDSDSDDDILVSSPKALASPLPNQFETSLLPIRPIGSRRRTTFYNSFPNSPNDSRTHLDQYNDSMVTSSSNTEVEDHCATDLPTHRRHPTSRLAEKLGRAWAAFLDFMTVSLWAALFSLLVACIQPLQHALTFHLQPVNGAINQLGKCAVPLTLIVLGAYFYTPPPEKTSEDDGHGVDTKPKKSVVASMKSALSLRSFAKSSRPADVKTPTKPGETKTVILAVAARMLITPLLILPLMMLATRYDFHRVFEDPVFVVCNIILLASPPALTLAQITQAVSGDAFERLISRTIFWSYCILTPPITIIYVVLGLLLAKM
ncbi:endoplasmic reticulum protein [Ephemerocybe angulata]|uniref:Endoplasmic reticulum protein n=1 Tax=Ephemerocybe angulata TaxID=980116 RepID=A0A8H6HPH9_9AGAR|nr:endoplasmic reticulum protein [Tulosesus angulatus]